MGVGGVRSRMRAGHRTCAHRGRVCTVHGMEHGRSHAPHAVAWASCTAVHGMELTL